MQQIRNQSISGLFSEAQTAAWHLKEDSNTGSYYGCNRVFLPAGAALGTFET